MRAADPVPSLVIPDLTSAACFVSSFSLALTTRVPAHKDKTSALETTSDINFLIMALILALRLLVVGHPAFTIKSVLVLLDSSFEATT